MDKGRRRRKDVEKKTQKYLKQLGLAQLTSAVIDVHIGWQWLAIEIPSHNLFICCIKVISSCHLLTWPMQITDQFIFLHLTYFSYNPKIIKESLHSQKEHI